MLYSSSARTVLVLTLLLLAASAGAAEMRFSTWMLPAEVSVTVGKHQVLMPLDKNGVSRHGLNCFPDEPICILQQRPLAYLMVGNKDGKNATFLMKGNSIKDAAPVATVLAPGPRGTVDEQYAGVTSVYRDLKNKRLVGFYHAEKPIPLGTIEHSGYPATLATCCVAEAPLDGSAFTKLGEFITADKPVIIPGPEVPDSAKTAFQYQGTNMPCVVQDAEGQYLLCYYHESSNSVTRGNQICLARCPIETSGMPGTWKKHYRDDFTEPGLGGKETPVISAGAANATTCPHVQYVKEWNRYVMIFGLIAGNDFLTNPQKASGSGTFVTTSRDGRNWTEPVKIETIFPAAINGHEAKIPTSLLITKATSTKIQGSLYYGYSPRWPIPHHMGSMPIQIALVNRDSAGESGSGPADFSGKPSPISFDGKTVVQTPLKRRSPVTLEAWIRPERNEKDVFVIGSMSAARHGIGLGLNNGILRAQYLYGDLGAPSRVPDSEWSHVAAVFGTDATHLYLNGKHVAKGPANSTCDDQPLFVIGDIGWDFSGHLFRGVVRAVRISDGVRYDRDFLPEGAFTQDSPTQKAKALLIYDGSRNASGEMLDRSGAGNHGRLVDSQPRKASPK